MDILFICKRNETYGFKTTTRRSSGLYNSTGFIVEALTAARFNAGIVEAIDNNCIDRLITEHKPKAVVIEALWVVPEKFHVLKRLHPHVKWFVHMHSGMSFLAQEGIATEWLRAYPHVGVGIIANSHDTFESFKEMVPVNLLHFLPNVYIPHNLHRAKNYNAVGRHSINVGCFGAIRPLKNQLVQAMAALRFARENEKILHFHINGTRQEVGGMPVLKNLINLFEKQPAAELIQHAWYEPEDFHHLLKLQIDISLQLSLSETFNVVSADAITCGVPIVVSNEVRWASSLSVADTEDIDNIVSKMDRALRWPLITARNQYLLEQNSQVAAKKWVEFTHAEIK